MLGAILLVMSVNMRAQEPSPAETTGTPATASEAPQPASEGGSGASRSTDVTAKAYRHSAAVKAIGAKLGLNTDQASTAFEVFNFALLALGLGWVLVRSLPKTFRNRNSAIQKHLVDARTATEEATARLSSVEERLSKLDGQIAAMRAQAEQDSAADEQRIKASVEDEKKKILAAAEQEISSATVQAQRAIQQYAAELAIDQAAKKLVVSVETDRLLVQGFARRLAGDESKEGQN